MRGSLRSLTIQSDCHPSRPKRQRLRRTMGAFRARKMPEQAAHRKRTAPARRDADICGLPQHGAPAPRVGAVNTDPALAYKSNGQRSSA